MKTTIALSALLFLTTSLLSPHSPEQQANQLQKEAAGKMAAIRERRLLRISKQQQLDRLQAQIDSLKTQSYETKNPTGIQ